MDVKLVDEKHEESGFIETFAIPMRIDFLEKLLADLGEMRHLQCFVWH